MVLSVTVDATGISAPSFNEILVYLQDAYRGIYGHDIYVEADSQDGQFLGVLATALHDSIDSAIAVYNDFSPSSAIGAGLSSVVKVNGITRHVSSPSQVQVRLVGEPGTVILNGIITDNINLGTEWALPPSVTIPADGPDLGETVVTAVCMIDGAIAARVGTLTNIVTPQLGWFEASNITDALLGAPVETDAQLRKRQSRAASLPAQSTLDGIFAGVSEVAGVGRVAVYQNDNAFTDTRGLPAHSIAVVHEGGNIVTIAEVVAEKKAPGVATFGYINEISGNRTYVIVFDPRGIPNQIFLNPMVSLPVTCRLVLEPTPAFINSTRGAITQAMITYYNNLVIAEPSYLTRAYGPANLMTQDAEDGTGLTELQLDVLTNSYHVAEIAQGRTDKMFSWWNIAPGEYWFQTSANQYYAINGIVHIRLDDATWHRALITSASGGFLYFTPAIPAGRNVSPGNLILKVGDLIQDEFWGAYLATENSILIDVI